MSTFVDVPGDALFAFLQSKGFTERVTRSSEVVFERAHAKNACYRMLVYTSVSRGGVASGRGKDAIRVCAIWEEGASSRGVAKLPRVHRSGSVDAVLGRMLDRMREAYARCSEQIGRRG